MTATHFFLTICFVVHCILLTLHATDQNYGGNFKNIIAHNDASEDASLYISAITYSSDIPLSTYEFFYLTNLCNESFITKYDIDKAYKNLAIKKRFSAINIDVFDDINGKRLHFTLIGNWIFKKLEFEGIWFGKPHFTTLYLQQPGDTFDAHLHEESLKLIQKYLHDQGYFGCNILDEILYKKKQKTVTAKIKVQKKMRFVVDKTTIIIRDQQHQEAILESEELSTITNTLGNKFHAGMHGVYYSKKYLHKTVNRIRAFLKEHGFNNVRLLLVRRIRASCPKVDLVLKVHLGKQKTITLEGNTIFSDEQIKDEFIGKDVPDWLFSPDIIAQQLLHEYYKKGFWQTKITPSSHITNGYHFTIKEGSPAIIDSVSVIDTLSHMPEKSGFVLNELLHNKKCDQTILDTSLERLKKFYQSSGFWDFNILETHFEKNKETGRYSIKILINKGIQRLWAGFSIEGASQLENHDFFKKFKNLNIHQRIPFNIHWLEEQRIFLLHYFQQQNNWYVTIKPNLIIIPDEKITGLLSSSKIFVQWKIIPGPSITFGKTILRGATSVDFKYINKQCACRQDEPWSRKSIEQTRKRIKRLDVFKTVQVQSYQLAKHKGKKPIIITVVDDDPIELRARLGYFLNSNNVLFKQQSTPKIGSSFIIKNPTNRADHISFVGDWNRFERTITIDYQLPSPFGFPAISNTQGFGRKYTHPVEIRNSGSSYQATEYGFLTKLSDEYKEDYLWSVIAGNEWVKITNVHGNLKLDPRLINITLPYFFIEPNLQIDKLDNPVNTTKGLYYSLAAKFIIPENNGDACAKITYEQSAFYPIYNKIIIAARLRFGHIFKNKFEKTLPTERFYLGGPDTVRGYEQNALPPLGESFRIENGKEVKVFSIQGGSSMLCANLELRFPLYKSFGIVLFQDVGVLSQSGLLGFKERWYPGSGFGIRYKTPIGSLRFDIGWKWKRRLKEDTKSYAWHLTLGEAF